MPGKITEPGRTMTPATSGIAERTCPPGGSFGPGSGRISDPGSSVVMIFVLVGFSSGTSNQPLLCIFTHRNPCL